MNDQTRTTTPVLEREAARAAGQLARGASPGLKAEVGNKSKKEEVRVCVCVMCVFMEGGLSADWLWAGMAWWNVGGRWTGCLLLCNRGSRRSAYFGHSYPRKKALLLGKRTSTQIKT